MRDALGSLQNLEQLLRSIKVGPRALLSVIPAVHASCSTLATSYREMLRGIATIELAPAAIDDFVAPRLDALERALAAAVGTPLYARERLALEAAVTRAAAELEAGRALIDLLESAQDGPATVVSLVEVVRSAHRSSDTALAYQDRLPARLAAATTAEVLANPRVASELVGIAVRLATTRQPGRPPRLRMADDEPGRVAITVDHGGEEGSLIDVLAPKLIEPTEVSARAAARTAGGEWTSRPDGCISLAWPAAPSD